MLAFTMLLAVLIDALLGEVKRFHPLVGFGLLAQKLEAKLNTAKQTQSNPTASKTAFIKGMLAWCLLVLPLPIGIFIGLDLLSHYPIYIQLGFDLVFIYFALGFKSLYQHGMQIYHALELRDLSLARRYCSYIVSRDTSQLTEQEISRACVESMLENSHDAVTATLICYLIGGAPLVILHRLANTLDAMWGYKNDRFIYFGKFSARADDVLGFVPAKLTALLYALLSVTRTNAVLKLAYQQAKHYKSHNGGWVMSAGASLLKIKLGGRAVYHNKTLFSPELGKGRTVEAIDIASSLKKATHAVILLILLTGLVEAGAQLLAMSR
ncbi:cobalamin biosynthesis protein [Catenovulum maritimum]|uniref:Cobalamin biosynthesis protein CobD n=1 Tax=Catenovulum maritimum TaxID=1513271 RepID=A0A0J8JMF0_9ALTE|nr:CobD/CbiB family cobalamin biosynthesis protein [Catenovulum maritimum]KMT65786.1 hypothetical protein XM47_07225 [Catenovulum maritimum]